MTGPSKRWHIYPKHETLSQKLAQKLNKDPVIAQILLNRNIRSLEDAKQFLDASDSYKDQFNLQDLEKLTSILTATIKDKKRIMVYGDYDVDGMTSTALITSALRECGARVDFYIPHRFTDGYGLSSRFLEKLVHKDYDLLMTLDCGISNHKEIEWLKSQKDMKVIILDHHTIPEKLPPADVILNPKALPDDHPLNLLCTVGIAYHAMSYFFSQTDKKLDITTYLDLVALGTIADIASLVKENRVLTRKGLALLSARKRPGINALLKCAEFKRPEVSSRDVGFMIAPRLNAAGRLAQADICVELLITQDAGRAQEIAQKLQKLNENRQKIGQLVLKEAEALLKENKKLLENRLIVLAGEGWHPGVIGITAAQLAQKYGKPTVIVGYDHEIGRGSARSMGDVNIYGLLKQCRDHFESFGGHKQAAGFSILPDKIQEFASKLVEVGQQDIDPEKLLTTVDIDCQLSPAHISLDLANELAAMGPFGEGNPTPVMYSNEFDPLEYKKVGDGSHLKVTFSDKNGKRTFDAIGFGLAGKMEILKKKDVEVIFHLETNDWLGESVPQLRLVDLK